MVLLADSASSVGLVMVLYCDTVIHNVADVAGVYVHDCGDGGESLHIDEMEPYPKDYHSCVTGNAWSTAWADSSHIQGQDTAGDVLEVARGEDVNNIQASMDTWALE